MGNYVSCTLSTPGGVLRHPCRAAKVIMPGGEIRIIDGPAKAAEIMLETPSFFLADSRGLKVGRKFSALGADEDLEMGGVYVMFPMKRLNSAVAAADMGAMFLAAEAAKKRRRSKAASSKIRRVLPEEENWRESDAAAATTTTPTTTVPKLNLDDIEDFSAPEFMHRLSMSRSKKPLLETIAEDQPVCIR